MKYPTLTRIMAENKTATPTVKFREAPEVEVRCWSYKEDGISQFECDESSARLLLPVITTQEYDNLPKTFFIKADHEYSDEFGRFAYIYFTFHVEVTGADRDPVTGEVELKYKAEVVEYEVD